jgi:hypothetical protein
VHRAQDRGTVPAAIVFVYVYCASPALTCRRAGRRRRRHRQPAVAVRDRLIVSSHGLKRPYQCRRARGVRRDNETVAWRYVTLIFCRPHSNVTSQKRTFMSSLRAGHQRDRAQPLPRAPRLVHRPRPSRPPAPAGRGLRPGWPLAHTHPCLTRRAGRPGIAHRQPARVPVGMRGAQRIRLDRMVRDRHPSMTRPADATHCSGPVLPRPLRASGQLILIPGWH